MLQYVCVLYTCVICVWHTDLQEVASLVNLLDVFIGKDAAGSLQLTLSLSRSSGDDGLMQTRSRQYVAMKNVKKEKLGM